MVMDLNIVVVVEMVVLASDAAVDIVVADVAFAVADYEILFYHF